MTDGFFDEAFRSGKILSVFDHITGQSRPFLGFLEPLSLTQTASSVRKKTGVIPTERFRLMAEAKEDFGGGDDKEIVCGSDEFELLSVKEFHYAGRLTHRECILLRKGRVQ